MYNASRTSILWFLPVLMLSVYMWGYFWPMYIHHSNISVPVGSGRYRMVSVGSHILSTSGWQINGKETCNWIAWNPVKQSNYNYRVIYSSWPSFPWFLSPFHLFVFPFPSSLYQLKIWIDWRCNNRVLNEAIIQSLWPTLWSLGILIIVLQLDYYPESVFGFLYDYSIFVVISFRVIDAQCSEF